MSAAKKFLLPLFFAVIFGLVVMQVEPPESLTAASPVQLLGFFIPLLLFLTFSANLYFKFPLQSFILSLGLTLILTFKALNFFIFFSIPAVLIATLWTVKSLKKSSSKSFSGKNKIPPKPNWLKLPKVKPESTRPKRPKLSRLPRKEK